MSVTVPVVAEHLRVDEGSQLLDGIHEMRTIRAERVAFAQYEYVVVDMCRVLCHMQFR